MNGLWIGDLTPIQELSIRSFLKNGHRYKLWVYDMENFIDLVEDLRGVELEDANQILDKKYIFKHWSGNLATFADIFRYKLLYERGGWWVDLDLVCLRKLPNNIDYFFGGERAKRTGAFKRKLDHVFWIGLMKFPKGDDLLKEMYMDMMEKRNDFMVEGRGLPFNYGQTKLRKLLEKEYGDDFLYKENRYDVDLFNPFSYFDMIDFFIKGDLDKCCKRWGWTELDVRGVLSNVYTVHLYNKIIKELEEKRGMKCQLLLELEKIVGV